MKRKREEGKIGKKRKRRKDDKLGKERTQTDHATQGLQLYFVKDREE